MIAFYREANLLVENALLFSFLGGYAPEPPGLALLETSSPSYASNKRKREQTEVEFRANLARGDLPQKQNNGAFSGCYIVDLWAT